LFSLLNFIWHKYYLVLILEKTKKKKKKKKKKMNLNLLFEIILVLLAILAINGIIFGLTFFNLKKQNSTENVSVIRNSSSKDGLALTSLMASNPISLTSSESSESQTLSVTSSESQTLSVTSSESQTLSVASSESQTLSVASSETFVSEDIFDFDDDYWSDSEINEVLSTHSDTSSVSNEEIIILPDNVELFDWTENLDSLTILDTQTFEQWREIAMDLHDHPYNSPLSVIQQIKFEELNILYSQDLIHYAITQTELRLIIEHFPASSLFNPSVNHLILTIMSYYHG